MHQIHKGFSRRDFKSRREADFQVALEVREQHGWRPRATWLSDGGLGLVKLMDGDNLWHMEWGNGQDKDTVARSHLRSLGVFSTYLTANKRSQVNFLLLGLFLFLPQYFADATQWTSISPQQTKKVRSIKGRWDKRGRGNLWSVGWKEITCADLLRIYAEQNKSFHKLFSSWNSHCCKHHCISFPPPKRMTQRSREQYIWRELQYIFNAAVAITLNQN